MSENKIESLPCFKCGKQLYEVFPKEFSNGVIQPYKGTRFNSQGHYGSTIFDPMVVDEELVVNICDDCLHENRDNARIESEARYMPEISYKKFSGYGEQDN